MRAVRDNELAAGVAGINVYRVKVAAFALSAVLGGIGGGLFAGGFAYVSPDQFSFAESIVFITMTLLGGVSSPIGALIGTGLLIVLPESLRFLKSVPGLYLATDGLAIILIIRYMPDGIWGFVQDRVRRLLPRPPPFAGAAGGTRADTSGHGVAGGGPRWKSSTWPQALRRRQGRRRHLVPGAARIRARADRSQRLGQDDHAERARRASTRPPRANRAAGRQRHLRRAPAMRAPSPGSAAPSRTSACSAR